MKAASRRRGRKDKSFRLNDWEEFLVDAGLTAKQAKKREGEDTKHGARNSRPAYFWTLRNGKGKEDWRICNECGEVIEDGECAVHEVNGWGDHGKPYSRKEHACWHTRCVSPERWRAFLGQPLGAVPNRAPKLTITTNNVQMLMDYGTIKPGPLEAAEIVKRSKD